MAMMPRLSNVLARLLRAAVEDPAQALAAVAVATLGTVVGSAGGAALAAGGGGVYWSLALALVVCFAGGVGAALASVWVSADAARRRATGQILLAASAGNLLVTVALSGFDAQIALSIFDAMLNQLN